MIGSQSVHNYAASQMVRPRWGLLKGNVIEIGINGAKELLKNEALKGKDMRIEDFGADWVILRDAKGRPYAAVFDRMLGDAVSQLQE